MSALLSRYLIPTLQIRKDVARLFAQRDLLATGGQSFPIWELRNSLLVLFSTSHLASVRFDSSSQLICSLKIPVESTERISGYYPALKRIANAILV